MICDLVKLDRPLISVDLETTGLYPAVDRIVQIGVVKVYPDGTVKEWESLIDPGIDIPPRVSEIHGITNEVVKDAPLFESIARKLHTGFDGCDFIGYNVKAFDIKFLIAEFARCGIEFKHGRLIDAYKILLRYNPRNLAWAVSHYLQEDHTKAHSALPDAQAALRVFRAQLIKHADLPRDMAEIDKMFQPNGNFLDEAGKIVWSKDGEAVLNFGQRAGIPLKKIDRSYLEWILRANFGEDVKTIVRNALAGKFPSRVTNGGSQNI